MQQNQKPLTVIDGEKLLDIFYKVKQHLLFIIISIVACVGAMGVYSVTFQKPIYSATASVMMSSNELTGTAGFNYSLNIIETYEEICSNSHMDYDIN